MTFVRYHVRHETLYRYDQVVGESHHLLRLTPRPLPWQRNLEHHLAIDPDPSVRRSFLDSFGNRITAIHFTEEHEYLEIISEFWVELRARPKPAGEALNVTWEAVRDALRYRADRPFTPEFLEAAAFRFVSPNVPIDSQYAAYASAAFRPDRPLVEAADDLMRMIHRDFSFDPTATETSTPVEQAFKARRGVCQDFSQIMIACLRSVGLAARYISGYILTHPPAGKERLVGADATHAWVALFVPGFGWLELDPTNAVRPDLEHITLGWGRDFSDVTPLRGVLLGGGEHEPEIAVTVVPEAEFGSLYTEGDTFLEELSS